MENRKINEYDLLKIICVILVVIGHVLNLYHSGGAIVVKDEPSFLPIRDFIYSFHMPVFMAISGAIYEIQKSKGKYQDNVTFLKNKVRRLMVPYFLFSIFLMLPTMCYVWHVEYPIRYYADNYLLAKDSRHLWFLFTLFYVFVFLNPIEKHMRNHQLLFAVVFFFCSRYVANYVSSLFCLNLFFKYAVWFYLGYLFEIHKECVMNITHKTWPVLVAYLCFSFAFSYNKVTINAPVCFCLLYYVCYKIKKGMGARSKAVSGKLVDYSMGIYLFHPMVLYIVAAHLCSISLTSSMSSLLLFIIGLSVSFLLTMTFKKMRLGAFLGE